MNEKRPPAIPVDAVWSPEDNEWVLAPKDDSGKNHGIAAYWRPDGTLVNHCCFEHGVPHGWYKRYHESGKVSRQGEFVNGKLHGTDVFYRSSSPSTERFPDGLSERVWRTEIDMRHGRIVAGRNFDLEGRQVSETGELFPERPSSVPGQASFSAKTRRWLDGASDDDCRRHGLWRFFDRNGVLVQETQYEHGTELWISHYGSAEEAEAELAMREGRLEDAAASARTLLNRIEESTGKVIAAALLTRALLGLSIDHEEIAELCDRTRRLLDEESALWGVFTEIGRKAFNAASRVLTARAQQLDKSDPEQALALVERAAGLPHADNTVRALQFALLRRLGRDDEAFQIGRSVLTSDPSAEGFASIKDLPEYNSWLKSIDTETMTLEGAWEVLGVRGERLQEIAAYITREHEGTEHIEDEEAIEVGGTIDAEWPVAEVLGERLSPELRRWIKDCPVEHMQSTYRGHFARAVDSTLSAAVKTQDGTWVARLQSLFLPAGALLIEDEEFWIAEWCPAEHGESVVWYQHQDDPGFEPVDASISAFLTRRICDDTSFEELVLPASQRERWDRASMLVGEHAAETTGKPPHLDIAVLEQRTNWIVRLFLGINLGDDLETAPYLQVWEREYDQIKLWPHLQAYWLLHHMVFDNREALARLLPLCELRYPPVRELARAARDILSGEGPDLAVWDQARVTGLRVRAHTEGRHGLFEETALKRLETVLAPQREAEHRLSGARALLAVSSDDSTIKALGLWDLIESASGAIDAFEQSGAQHLIEDEDLRIKVLMGIKKGQLSILPHLFAQLGAALRNSPDRDSHWLALFEAAFDRGAAMNEEHAVVIPGSIYGLGIALGDFDSLMDRVRSAPIPGGDPGRRRRLELVVAANDFFDQSESAREYMRSEAVRFAEQFSDWKTDTYAKALYLLLERGDVRGIELFNECFIKASFSGANWEMAMDLVDRCREKRIMGTDSGLWAAVEKKLGRHDDGRRASVLRAFACCARDKETARERLEARQTTHDDTRKICEDAAIIAGLLELAPQDYAEVARETLHSLLEERVESMEFGAGVSLLQAASDAGLDGFVELERTFYERARNEQYMEKPLLEWLTARQKI